MVIEITQIIPSSYKQIYYMFFSFETYKPYKIHTLLMLHRIIQDLPSSVHMVKIVTRLLRKNSVFEQLSCVLTCTYIMVLMYTYIISKFLPYVCTGNGNVFIYVYTRTGQDKYRRIRTDARQEETVLIVPFSHTV